MRYTKNDDFKVEKWRGSTRISSHRSRRSDWRYCVVKRKSQRQPSHSLNSKGIFHGNKDEDGKVKKKRTVLKKQYVDMGETFWGLQSPPRWLRKVVEAQGLRIYSPIYVCRNVCRGRANGKMEVEWQESEVNTWIQGETVKLPGSKGGKENSAENWRRTA